MTIALVHEHFDRDHLEVVKAEMQELGAPTIKAVYVECHDIYAALEGCHRIRAAKELGLVPEIEEVEYSEELVEGMDGEWTVAEIVDGVSSATLIDF